MGYFLLLADLLELGLERVGDPLQRGNDPVEPLEQQVRRLDGIEAEHDQSRSIPKSRISQEATAIAARQMSPKLRLTLDLLPGG
jgi:hypothetical protein